MNKNRDNSVLEEYILWEEKILKGDVAYAQGQGRLCSFDFSHSVEKSRLMRAKYHLEHKDTIPLRDYALGYSMEESSRIAHIFNDNDSQITPEVEYSYKVFQKDISQQFSLIKDHLSILLSSTDPYATSSHMRDDVENGVIQSLKTSPDSFSTDVENHPMLEADDDGILFNDKFRVVHDVLAHGEGFSFGEVGEFYAWNVHRQCIHPDGYLALFNETRAQNCWNNFYPGHNALPLSQRPFALQKVIDFSQFPDIRI